MSLVSNSAGLLLVPAEVNGRPALALIDTGMTAVVLSRRFAEALGRPLEPIGEATSVGGVQKFWKTSGVRVAFASLRLPEAALQVADFSAAEAVLGRQIDVVIGASLLSEIAIEVDLDHGRLRVLPTVSDDPAATSVPLAYDRTTRRITLPGVVAGVKLPIMLDTGSDGGFTIGAEALEQLPGPVRKLTTLAVAGGGGIEVETIVELPSLEVGRLALRNVRVSAANRGGYLVKAGVPAMVGMEILSRYDFIVDGPLKRLLLRPRENKPPEAPRSTVGVQGAYKPDRIAIVHIMANSPAEKAGLRAGDEICAVNDEKVADGWTHSPMRNWGSRPAGQAYRITLCSGRGVPLVSAAFY